MIKTFQMLSVSKICISQTINIIYLYLMKEKCLPLSPAFRAPTNTAPLG